jgi:hypothetical protein
MLPEESETDVPAGTASVTKSIIRCFSTDFLPPDTIAPWLLISGDNDRRTNETLDVARLPGVVEMFRQ